MGQTNTWLIFSHAKWASLTTYLNLLVRLKNDCDENVEHHVDEECYEGVEEDARKEEYPHSLVPIDDGEGDVHVVAVDQAVEALEGRGEGAELHVEGSHDDPGGEDEGEVEHEGTRTESKQSRYRSFDGAKEELNKKRESTAF